MSRINNFGVLRLFFASLVIASHSVPLAGSNSPEPLYRLLGIDGGELAVDSFFVLSGYLVTLSWHRTPSAAAFLRKRALRIYPGFFVAFIFSLFVALAVTGDTSPYLTRIASNSERLLRELLFLDHGSLNSFGAFAGNPFPSAVNGSLWTLQPELRCYGLILAFGIAGWLRNSILRIGFVGLYAVHVLNLVLGVDASFVRLLTYFAAGAMWTTMPRSVLRLVPYRIVAAVVMLSLGLAWPAALHIVLPMLGSFVLLGIATSNRAVAPAFFHRWDLSYGIYLYAFPVQQTLVWLGIRSATLLFCSAFPITLALALASWSWIERPALRLKPFDITTAEVSMAS